MSNRIHPHSPLPAPAMRASTPTVQSKSHVLAGVQDAYWSDDEAEDTECPLCLEEMDISDLNFKPCPCGYQICRFCWHHIKENLNGRCPACRREYTDDAVQFKPINKEDHKRLTQQKKQRERERKELDALGRRQLANVRVVQRNVVYVVGIGPRFAKEEYGKISKIMIVKRTPPGGRAPIIGLYITFHRREDAARCITAVDGAPSPSGGNEVLRASYGTTKYCMAFLRGVSCQDHGCMNLHEWGDENDCFTKEDLTTLKHTMKDTENRTRTVTVVKKADEGDAGLPRAASWAAKNHNNVATTALLNSTNANQAVASSRQSRRPGSASTTRTQRSTSSTTSNHTITSSGRERKSTKAPSLASASRPATPASSSVSSIPPTTKVTKQKDTTATIPNSSRPSTPAGVDSDVASVSHDVPSTPPETSTPLSPEAVTAVVASPAVPPGLPALPPGLPAPPGLPPPTRTPLSTDSSPQLPVQTSQGPYQISTQAQALLEDVKARREATSFSSGPSPFPDFDRMLQLLTATDNGFSFNLDPKLAGEEEDQDGNLGLPDFGADPSMPFNGSFIDAFPRLRQAGPPGLGLPPHLEQSFSATRSPATDRPSTASSYTGSFDPFAPDSAEDSTRQYASLDEERKVSRFTFARGRQGSSPATLGSPLHVAASLSHSETSSPAAYYSPSEVLSPSGHASPQWGYATRNPNHEYLHQSHSSMSSPLAQYAQAQPQFSPPQQQQQPRFQPFDSTISEAQLRDFINSSRDRAASMRPSNGMFLARPSQPFADPAIMSARLASPGPMQDAGYGTSPSGLDNYQSQHLAYGPPPGLAFPQGIAPNHVLAGRQGQGLGGVPPASLDMSQAGSAHVSASNSPVASPAIESSAVASPALSSSDFPALSAADPPSRNDSQQGDSPQPSTPVMDSKAQAKADRKAARKVAAEERAAARLKLAQEKAAAKVAEKERLAQEKAAEKEKAAALKAEKEKAAALKIEQEKAAKEKAEAQRAAKEKAEKARLEKEREQRERAAKEKAEKAAAKSRQAASPKTAKQSEPAAPSPPTPSTPQTPKINRQKQQAKPAPLPAPVEPVNQAPILAKMPKKNKPVAKPIKIPKEDSQHDIHSTLVSATNSEAPQFPDMRGDSNDNSRAQSVDAGSEPKSLEQLLADINIQQPWMRLHEHPFFDSSKISPSSKMPLEYGPLVHALSALSVGGGSFANNMPSGSIDNAVSSFQQLLETLTQTISDLLRLLPRTTWDDSSSFDSVLRDMLKGDDFLEDGGEEQVNQGKDDEVAQLTLALERRARWMEVQLSKLEELHRDINTAAVRAVLAFNDNGWDAHGFMPRIGNTLQYFEQMSTVEQDGAERDLTAAELEQKLGDAMAEEREAATRLEGSVQRMATYLTNMEDEEEY
ncbi:hypothetical protein EIP86_002302 [Pleurotus ostreatoroseus]|nr:hypothetical protein EIP86_002302 [Pleurotus ostreatoroseus]